MAKLTDRQKSNIKAKWDTGQYTKTALAKTYKVDEKIIREIVGKEKPINAHIVEAQLLIEETKKSEKSPNEIQAINQAVEYRLKEKYADDKKRVKIYDLTDTVLDKVEEILKKGKKQIVMKVKEYNPDGGNSESLDVVDVELDTSDLKNLQDTIDKASITNNVNQRHSNQNINVQTNTAIQNNEVTQTIVKETLQAFNDEY